MYHKNPNIIVTPQRGGDLRLFERSRFKSIILTGQQISAWLDWPPGLLHLTPILPSLLEAGIIRQTFREQETRPTIFDYLQPRPSSRWIKWYRETTDLTILFNTAAMACNNPLLALGPYSSLIWSGLCGESTIGKIRNEANRIFGCDEVIPFIKRLMDLGFIEPVGQLKNVTFPNPEIIKEFPAPEIQFILPQSRVPWYCLWEICLICDERCKICYLPNFEAEGPRGIDRDRIIEEIIGSGIFYVTLLGGEALLRDDLEEIVERLREASIFVKLITNGLQLTSKRALSLAEVGLNQIEVSFDGLTVSTHDWSRGTGKFARAEQALIHALQREIPRVGVVLTIYAENFSELDELPNFMHLHDISECYLSLFRKTGMLGSRSKVNPLSVTQAAALHKQVGEWHAAHQDLIITLLQTCTCGRSSMVIGVDKQLRPCPFTHALANETMDTKSLIEMWQSLGKKLITGKNIPDIGCLIEQPTN